MAHGICDAGKLRAAETKVGCVEHGHHAEVPPIRRVRSEFNDRLACGVTHREVQRARRAASVHEANHSRRGGGYKGAFFHRFTFLSSAARHCVCYCLRVCEPSWGGYH